MFRLRTNKLLRWTGKNCRPAVTKAVDVKLITVPESADVVVIGGGSAGCNALYHLGKHGIKAVLLEKSKLISGTTWHTAGLVWSLRGPSDIEMELLKVSRKVLSSLEEETGINPGWINNGGLYIAQSYNRLDEYRRLVTASKAFGIEAHLISNHEAKERFPLLDEKIVKGAVYCPSDGVVDPAMYINSLTKSAKNHGCKVIEDCPVLGILTKETTFGRREVTAVETPHGVIKTNVVLNAAGAWSKNIAKMAGVDIPLTPMKHAYVVTEAIENTQGLPNVRDPDISLYFRVQGGVISIGGYEQNPVILPYAPKDFSFSLYELDWNVFNVHIESMIQLIPTLANTGIRSTICGPESFTPDHKQIMGEDPRCAGLFYSCGYNSAGMMFGGGCGEQAASWIMNGRPKQHMFTYDIRRFIPDQRTDIIWLNERSHEAYAKNYDIVYAHDQHLSGRNFKTDPFHDVLVEAGGIMEERQGWERPGWFWTNKVVQVQPYDYYGYYGNTPNKNDDYQSVIKKECSFNFSPHHDTIKEEALSCRQNAALFDMSYFGKFYLCGPDAQKAADFIFTANTRRDINKTVYTCSLNKFGGVEIDCTVTPIEAGSSGIVDPIFKGTAFYIVTGGASAYHSWAHIDQIIRDKKFNATLHDFTEQIGVLSIQGPQSQKILQTLIHDELSNETFPFSTTRLIRIRGELVRAFRLSFVGELGYELHIPKHSCDKVYKAVMESGKRYKMKLAGFRALYSLSCEKGYHLWGCDLRSDDNPVEANLSFTCRKDGRYLGHAVVQRLLKTGVKRKLAQLHVDSDLPMWGLETVYRDGKVVGYVRRAEYGFTFDKNIGHGYIQHPDGQNVTKRFLQSGTYEVEIMGQRYPAELYTQSPFDPENKRLLGMYDV